MTKQLKEIAVPKKNIHHLFPGSEQPIIRIFTGCRTASHTLLKCVLVLCVLWGAHNVIQRCGLFEGSLLGALWRDGPLTPLLQVRDPRETLSSLPTNSVGSVAAARDPLTNVRPTTGHQSNAAWWQTNIELWHSCRKRLFYDLLDWRRSDLYECFHLISFKIRIE